MGMTDETHCTACGTADDVRHAPLVGDLPICGTCYLIWYDSGGITEAEALGRERARRETAREFPFKESTDER